MFRDSLPCMPLPVAGAHPMGWVQVRLARLLSSTDCASLPDHSRRHLFSGWTHNFLPHRGVPITLAAIYTRQRAKPLLGFETGLRVLRLRHRWPGPAHFYLHGGRACLVLAPLEAGRFRVAVCCRSLKAGGCCCLHFVTPPAPIDMTVMMITSTIVITVTVVIVSTTIVRVAITIAT